MLSPSVRDFLPGQANNLYTCNTWTFLSPFDAEKAFFSTIQPILHHI